MILHPREDWQLSSNPVTGPKLVNLGGYVDNVVHYPGAGPNADFTDPVKTLRAIQRDYTTNRNYSIGYSFAIDLEGEVWELRGTDITPAATAGYNTKGLATFFLVPGQQKANNKQVETFVELHWILEIRVAHSLGIYGHRNKGTTATVCPGTGIYEQLPLFRELVARPPVDKKPSPETLLAIGVI